MLAYGDDECHDCEQDELQVRRRGLVHREADADDDSSGSASAATRFRTNVIAGSCASAQNYGSTSTTPSLQEPPIPGTTPRDTEDNSSSLNRDEVERKLLRGALLLR